MNYDVVKTLVDIRYGKLRWIRAKTFLDPFTVQPILQQHITYIFADKSIEEKWESVAFEEEIKPSVEDLGIEEKLK